MKIISFIEQGDVIERILKHCVLWKDQAPRPPPEIYRQIPVLESALGGLPDYTPQQADSRIFHHTMIKGLRHLLIRA